MSVHRCPVCTTGLLSWLGSLGKRAWFRCRSCGHECSKAA